MKITNFEFNFDKKTSHNSGHHKLITTKTTISTLIIVLLLSTAITHFITPVQAQPPEEPTIGPILGQLGYNHVVFSGAETFPAGIYQIKFLAEFGEYSNINALNYYEVGTSEYFVIFGGTEGNTEPFGGYIIPPVSKTLEIDTSFGLSMFAIDRYFTEHWRNPDYPAVESHAKVFLNLDQPDMFLIFFEDYFGGLDMDYNDMVLSMTQTFPPEIVSVNRSPENPTKDEPVTINAQINQGSDEIDSVILSYQIGSSTWIEINMNEQSGAYTAEIPNQPYNTIVKYRVTAYDTNGYSAVSQIESYTPTISGSSPIASMTYSPPIADTNQAIEFDASSSYDPDGTIVSYSWDFGDGTTGNGAVVNHSYEEDGEYLITLQIVDDDGLISAKSAIQIVKNQPPIADFIEPIQTIKINQSISFDARTSSDSDGTIVSYTWSFGDGSAGTGTTISHSYSQTGFHTITLVVADNDGATDQKKYTLFVEEEANRRPLASFTATPLIANIEQTITFDASESSDPDGSIVSYLWDFGDGTTDSGVTVDHSYLGENTYTVTLTVTDDDGVTDLDSTVIVITTNPIQNQVPIITTSSQMISTGEKIHFDASSSYHPDGNIVNYSWNFGDGTTAIGVEVDHTYQTPAVYTITLTTTDNNGLTEQTTTSITVVAKTQNSSPAAVITKSEDTANIEQTITFDASESSDPDGSIVSYLWDFGDGTTSTEISVNHTYSEEGTYTINLTVTDNDGATSSAVENIIVEQATTSFDILSIIGIGIAILTVVLLIVFLLRRNRT